MAEDATASQSSVTISLCMIVKNEAKTIGRCLGSVREAVDEIILVDTGSTDATKEIASQYGAKLYDFKWIDDFAAARNFAFSLATRNYILWLDADDILLQGDRENLLKLKSTLDPAVDAVNMLYNLAFNEHGQVTYQLRRNRLTRRSKNFRWIGAVHEYLEVYGNIASSDIAVTHRPLEHDSDRNLRIYEQRLASGENFSPRDLYYFANELYDHQQYQRATEYYQKFLASKQCWVEDAIGACGKLADCFYHLGDTDNQLRFTLESFKYDTPRAEFCCRLGYHNLQANQLKPAVFWYKLATELEKPATWGLINFDCWTWLPHIQLCVCYSRLGEFNLAQKHNELAAEFIPDNPMVLHNRRYLQQMLGKSATTTEAPAD